VPSLPFPNKKSDNKSNEYLLPVILLQLFIAVINENFDVAEELKKGKQATNYYATQHPVRTSAPWLRRFNPYRWFKANPKSVAVENLPSNLILPMQKAVIQDLSINSDFSGMNVSRSFPGV
jgi:voltage-dependent calcium channel